MRKSKLMILFFLSIMVFTFTPPVAPATVLQADAKVVSDTSSSLKNQLLDKIIDKDKAYADYTVDITAKDYDGDGHLEYFYIFTKKGASKDDLLNFCADIWYGCKSGVSRVLEWQYILPDTYGTLELAGRYYFRYDLAYATTSRTVLLSTGKGKCKEAFSPIGAAQFVKGSNEFNVTGDSYDMEYIKEEKYTCGHTWKNYYFYADKKGIHEYGATKISEENFLKYPGAKDIRNQLKKKYEGKNITVAFRYLKRSNGLLHINIYCDKEDCIDHYFATYRIEDKNKLAFVESDAGIYKTALNKSIAVY